MNPSHRLARLWPALRACPTRLGRAVAVAARELGRLTWNVWLRSPRSMGFRRRSILWARLGLLFGIGLMAGALYEQRHRPPPARQMLLARDYLFRRQVDAAIRFEKLWRRMDIEQWVGEAARRHDVDADLIHAVIQAESNYRPLVISPVGACGLMQIMPDTVRHLGGGNPFDPRENIDMGARYLAELNRRFDQNHRLVIAAYNAGPGAVRRHGGVPPYNETRVYVERVLSHYGARKARRLDAEKTDLATQLETETRRPKTEN